jgi:hypothetical protein
MKLLRSALCVGLLCAVCSHAVGFAQTPSAKAPNAAVIYWQAFSALPSLTAEEQKTFGEATKINSGPLSESAQQLLSRFSTSFRELHRARSVTPCDWQLDETAGPLLLLPHLQKARELSRAACMRARLRFANQQTDDALTELLAVLKLAHDCGSSPIIISFLVDVAIEKEATDVLAAHLPQLKPEQLERLTTELKALPATATVTDCIRTENQMFSGWLERRLIEEQKKLTDPQAGWKLLVSLRSELGTDFPLKPNQNNPTEVEAFELLKKATMADVFASLKNLREDYDELVRISTLPAKAQHEAMTQWEEALEALRTRGNRESMLRFFSHSLMPAIGKVLERSKQHKVRRELVDLAIQVQRHGKERIQPDSGVEYHKTETGFELRAPHGEALVVGKR